MESNEKERSVEILLKEIKQLTSDCIDKAMDIISKRHPNERYNFDSISFDERKVTVHFIEDSPGDFKEFRHVYLEVSDIATSLQDWDSKMDSHSPTISDVNDPANDDSMLIEFQHLEHNTLQEGDFMIGTEEQYRRVLDVYFDYSGKYLDAEKVSEIGYLLTFRSVRTNRLVLGSGRKLTKLTPEEFLRRAENTFNNQKS